MAGSRHFENKIHFNGHNSVATAHIHTKFDLQSKTYAPEIEIP